MFRSLLLWWCVALAPGCMQAQQGIAQHYLFQALNAARDRAGLPPLLWNQGLSVSAARHVETMRKQNAVAHQLGLEAGLPQRAFSGGVRFSFVSENVGVAPSAAELYRMWSESPEHRDNMLDPAVDTVGIAVLEANGTVWGVEDFARTTSELSLSQQESRVDRLLLALRVPAGASDAARAMCSLDTGYVGRRPAFVMRFQSGDLARLPPALLTRLQRGEVSSAAVGACSQPQQPFAAYRVAVVLYP